MAIQVMKLDELLTELRLRRWTLFRWGSEDDPALVAAVFKWNSSADVIILRRNRTATGYRVPTREDSEIFRPRIVSFQYHGPPLWTLRAVLTLPEPGPGELHAETPHRDCRIPTELPKPIVIRPLGTARWL
jgi:hypothetical protein